MSDCLSMLDKLNNNGLSYLTRFHNEFLDNTQRSQLCDLYERVPNSKISKCNWVSAAILDLCKLLNGMQNNSNRIYVFHSLAVQNQDKNGMLPLLKWYCVSENSSVLNCIHYFRFSRHFLYLPIIGDNHITQHCSKMTVELFFAGLNMTIVL
jgi:hypothetical protein